MENAQLCQLLHDRMRALYTAPAGAALLAGVERGDAECQHALDNEEAKVFFRSANDSMCVRSGSYALEVRTQALLCTYLNLMALADGRPPDTLQLFRTSDRIAQDLRQALTRYAAAAAAQCPAKVILRKWEPLPLEAEFRACAAAAAATGMLLISGPAASSAMGS